jgi:streptogramin lyase
MKITCRKLAVLTCGLLVLVAAPASASNFRIRTFRIRRGVGEPWGMAVDTAGNIWFAEPGCDFEPLCAGSARTGQIGEFDPFTHKLVLHTLPRIPGNQPIFLAFDDRGKLWFTTPGNSKIGEYDPSRDRFVGQWSMTPGSGPWDLTYMGGKIWYTEHLGAAIGSFDPATHAHRDFPTPSPASEPYGIVANRGLIWFTEDNTSVDRVAVLDTRRHEAIREYPVTKSSSGASAPHMITVGPRGDPWWTEGFSGTIATLSPSQATPGTCEGASATCPGVRRFSLPSPTGCTLGTHTSGIAFDRSRDIVWLDDSLTGQVGSFQLSHDTFRLTKLTGCNDHPHDGLVLGHSGNLWFDEEFANRLGELSP